jgi:putative SOS response-associated peptidase YedK
VIASARTLPSLICGMDAAGELKPIGVWPPTTNSLAADIHDRMPLVLAPEDYVQWPDPADLMRPFAAELMRMRPVSTRVNKPENDEPSIVEPVEAATDAA